MRVTRLVGPALILLALGCAPQIELGDPEPSDPHPGPTGNGPLPPEGIDTSLGEAVLAPPTGWTEVKMSFKVQNWTDAPMDERFTNKGGVFTTRVFAGEKRVEMRWDDWDDQTKEHMWEGEVNIEPGSTRTAIMQIKSNEDGEPIYIQVFNTSGDLRNNGDSTSIAQDTYGEWFNLKTAFNPTTGVGRAWINDKLVKMRQYRTPTRGWYFKNGTYNNGLPEGAHSEVHFRNIHTFRNDKG
jgi:hypothetical protein